MQRARSRRLGSLPCSRASFVLAAWWMFESVRQPSLEGGLALGFA